MARVFRPGKAVFRITRERSFLLCQFLHGFSHGICREQERSAAAVKRSVKERKYTSARMRIINGRAENKAFRVFCFRNELIDSVIGEHTSVFGAFSAPQTLYYRTVQVP